MISPNSSLASPREYSDSKPRVTSGADGLIVEWYAPPTQITVESNGRSMVSIAGFAQTSQPGAPILPFSSVLVALPPDANPSVKILESTETTELLQAPLKLAEQPGGVQLGSEGQIIGGGFIPASRETIFEAQPVVLEELGIVRGVRLARLTFYPTLPDGDILRVTSHLKVDVQFNAVTISAMAAETSGDPLLAAVNSAVINPERLQIASSGYPTKSPNASLQLADTPPVAIEVSQTSLTEISYTDLVGTGFPVASINPKHLHLKRDGEAIAYQWLGDSDPVFEANEEIRFFADPRFSRWAPFDTYVLSKGVTDGLRMKSRSAAPGSWPNGTPWVENLFEENKIYTPECYCAPIPAGRDGDRWVWDRLQRPSPHTGTYTFQLDGVDQSKTAQISVWMIGFTEVNTNPDHQIDVTLNGHGLGSRQWDGKNPYEAEFSFSGSWLNDGGNTLTITIPEMASVPVNGIWLDAFSVRHARSPSESTGADLRFTGVKPTSNYTISLVSTAGLSGLDVSNPDEPEELDGIQIGTGNSITLADPGDGHSHQYYLTTSSAIQAPDRLRLVAPMRLGGEFEGADYLIISPDEFIPSLADLIDLRGSNGLQVGVEDVQAIYDAYGDGRPDPEDIYEFLSNAYFTWTQPPIYVLLIGDGTFDPKQYLTDSSETFIPPFLADVDPWAGETAADNRYVTVDGEDTLPDMLIGRLPTNSVAELETMISKIVGYETSSGPKSWQHQAVFIADNADNGGNFSFLAENLLQNFSSTPFVTQRLYYSPTQVASEFRQQVRQTWNAGSGVIMYTGHASIHQWAHEIFFHLEDIPGLNNSQKLPVALEMTCFTGSFHVPGFPTLDEALVRHPNGGAVAAWGSTGLGIATGHHWLAEGFMNSVYRDGIGDLGTATLVGKLNLATIDSYTELIDTFTLLGDPATELERSIFSYLPITQN